MFFYLILCIHRPHFLNETYSGGEVDAEKNTAHKGTNKHNW